MEIQTFNRRDMNNVKIVSNSSRLKYQREFKRYSKTLFNRFHDRIDFSN